MTDKEQKSAEVAPKTAAFGQKSTEVLELQRVINAVSAACDMAIRRAEALEAELEAVGAGGVQALSAAPREWKLGQQITEEMHVAACKVLLRGNGLDGLPQRMLDAMLAASPTPPAEQPDLTKLTERGAVAWAGVDAQELRDGTYQQSAPKAAPTRTALPEGWTDCTIEFGNDGPEVVAYGPKRMMNRLAKWLGKYFAQVIADAAPKAAPGEPYKEELARLVATVDAGSSADYRALQEHRVMRTARAVLSAAPKQEAQDATVAAFEAVRKKLCALPRYSFALDSRGNVRRCEDKSGNWIEFDEAHALFDPVSVDAALAAQGGRDAG